MSAKGKTRPPRIPLEESTSNPKPRAAAGTVFAIDGERRMMTRDERVAFIDSIRSNFKGPVEDSTPLIRQDRDER